MLRLLAGLALLVLSVDLADDGRWDLSSPETFAKLRELAVEGLIDLILGGPPCATWSRLRFRLGGPRPLRFRDALWGRLDASPIEAARLCEANTLMLNSLGLMEPVVQAGGLQLLEHPDDPELEPMPSIWITEEWKGFQSRCGSARCRIHQCPFGCVAKKPTCLGTNMEGFADDEPRCDGSHTHSFEGMGRRDEAGGYRSRRLPAYPPAMCEWISAKIIKVFSKWRVSGHGPTGWHRAGTHQRSITNWSSLPSLDTQHAVTFLNETAARAQRAVIDRSCSGFHLHVDDGVLLSAEDTRANSLMHFAADAKGNRRGEAEEGQKEGSRNIEMEERHVGETEGRMKWR